MHDKNAIHNIYTRNEQSTTKINDASNNTCFCWPEIIIHPRVKCLFSKVLFTPRSCKLTLIMKCVVVSDWLL